MFCVALYEFVAQCSWFIEVAGWPYAFITGHNLEPLGTLTFVPPTLAADD